MVCYTDMSTRPIFYISDQTGITVETLGNSLLKLYPSVKASITTLPFIDTLDKAVNAVEIINESQIKSSVKPILFLSIINPLLRNLFRSADFIVLDLFESFLEPLTKEFNISPSSEHVRSHKEVESAEYETRMDATNFALGADDGITLKDYDKADIILTGVSRSGKTPTCLFLALRYGIYAANYPLTEEDLEESSIPKSLLKHRNKLYGLYITPERLRNLRIVRRGEGRYASQQQVNFECRSALTLFQRNHISYSDSTFASIEEVASRIFSSTGLKRRINF